MIMAKKMDVEGKKYKVQVHQDKDGSVTAEAHGPLKDTGSYGGLIFGKGMTEEEAIEDLKKNITNAF